MISGFKAIESDFPSIEVSQIAKKESWRKEINRPIYHIHKWWAKRLGSIFRAIALGALSSNGDDIWSNFYKKSHLRKKIILDPFMGSGTTLGEAIKLGCQVVGCDINPISTFIVRQSLAKVSEDQLKAVFSDLEQKVAPKIRQYYQTDDPRTGEKIPVLYYFWVKIVDTPGGESIPLFSNYIFSRNAYPKKKPNSQILCPSCWNIIEARFDATHLVCSHCKNDFNPQLGTTKGQFVISSAGKRYKIKELIRAKTSPPEHRMYAILALRADGEKIYLPVTNNDIALFQEASERLSTESLPLPTMAVRAGHNTNQALGYNYLNWRDFFNPRQLLSLGFLLRAILEIKDETIREQFICLFSSTLEFNNMFCTFKGEGTGAVRHMFSNHILKPERTPLENSVWGTQKSSGTFLTLFESRLLQAKRYLSNPFEIKLETDLFGPTNNSIKITASEQIDVRLVEKWPEISTNGQQTAMVINGNSANLPIPNEMIDAIITDPPYFDFIHYSELSDFFFAWLSPILKDKYISFERENSFHTGEVQNKDPHLFAKQLSLVFIECHRVLRNEGLLIFTFHHSRPEGWAAIYEAVVDANFKIVAAHPVYAELKAASPKSATKSPISLDAILVCRKRTGNEEYGFDADYIEKKFKKLERKFESNDFKLSSSDKFVILASQMIVSFSGGPISFKTIVQRIQEQAQIYIDDE